MARFVDPNYSLNDAINAVVDLANETASHSYVALTADDPTLTAAQMVNGIVAVSGQTTAQAVTTATAAAIVAALENAQVGSSFEFTLMNGNTSSGAATVTAASAAVTLIGTVVVPISKTQLFKGIVTNATAGGEAVTLVALLTAPV